MSDFEGDSESNEVDVLNLKVVDLKKRLKSLGLPIVGKKADLVARLQAALMARKDAAVPLDSACGSSPSKVKDYVPEDNLPSSEVTIGEDSGKSEEIYLSEGLDESFHSKDLVIDLKDEDLEEEDEHGHLDNNGIAKSQDAEIFQMVSTTVVYPENSGKSEEIDLSEDLDESFHSKELEMDLKDEDLKKEDKHGDLDSEGMTKFQDAEIFHTGTLNIVPKVQDAEIVRTGTFNIVPKVQDAEIFRTGTFNIVPSIKRCLPQEEVETVKPRKILKKNNFPTPNLAAKVVKAEEEVNKSGDIAEKSNVVPGAPIEPRKKIMVKLTNNPYRGLSDSAKQEKRAQRFNISSQEKLTVSNENKKHVSKSQQTVQKTENIAYPAPTLDVLRKRAERFGETSSTLLKKLEDEERLNQRKIRFGNNAGGNKDDDDEEKKKKRAERFGK